MASMYGKNKDASDPKVDDTKPSTSDEPKIKTDEKSGADLAALNANGPGTEEAKREALKRSGQQSDDEGDYVVAEGKSVTSSRGILGPGTNVSPKDFSAGQEGLDAHVKAGTLVRKGEQRREGDAGQADANKSEPPHQ